jgi:integral membrane protein
MLLSNFANKQKIMTKLFKFVAISEGISYLVLFFNMLVIKPTNPELYKDLLFPIGMAHGVLFISYVVLAFIIWKKQQWNFKEFFIVQVASLLPFGTFYIEKKYLKNA